MKINELKPFKNYHSLQSNVDYLTGNYIVGIKKEDDKIEPIFYYDKSAKDWRMLAEEDLNGDVIRIEQGNSDTNLNYSPYELLAIIRLKEGHRFKVGDDIERFFVYPNYITKIENRLLVEIFEGILDINNQTFKPLNEEVYNIIKSVYTGKNKEFYIQTNDFLYGPVIIDKDDVENEQFKLIPPIGSDSIKKLGDISEQSFLEFETLGTKRKIIKYFHDIKDFLIEEVDFINDEDLIIWATTLPNEKINATELLKGIEQKKTTENERIFTPRLERLKLILDEKKHNKSVNKLIEELKQTENFKEQLDIEKNKILDFRNERNALEEDLEEKKRLLAEKSNEVEKIEKELEKNKKDFENEINEIENTFNRKKLQLETKSKKLEEQRISEASEEYKKLQVKNNELLEEINKNNEVVEKVKSYKEIDNLKSIFKYQKEEEEKNLKKIKQQQQELIEVNKRLEEEFKNKENNATEIITELIKSKPYLNLLNNSNNSQKIDFIPVDYGYNEEKEESFKDINELFDEFSKKLKSVGRDFTGREHFLQNILISIHQNTLTFLCGQPGVGKTSLANIISKSLSPEGRNLEIPIGKGWTSSKDLIGFANPLNNTFHESNGFYKLLKQLNHEESYSNSSLSYVILDEANLSPMEYYWAIFLNKVNQNVSENNLIKIELGKNEVINYPNNLRFIATINNDHTTEVLSPRLIDRANIIILDEDFIEEFRPNYFDESKIQNLQVTFLEIISLFNLKDFSNPIISEFKIEEDKILKEILERLKLLKIKINPRIRNAILQYNSVANKLMYDPLRPIDYCIAQRLLPKINCHGEKYSKVLKELKAFLLKSFNHDDSPSIKVLEKIILNGEENHHFYNFFSSI